MKLSLSLSVLALTVGQLALADELERISIKGFHADITETEVRELNTTGKYCATEIHMQFPDGIYPLKGSKILGCNPFTIANQPATVIVMRNGTVMMSFDSKNFDAIVAALKAKYESAPCKDSSVRNRLGSEFTQTVCTWETAEDVLMVRRFSDKLDTGGLMLTSRKTIEESSDKRKGRDAANAQDL